MPADEIRPRVPARLSLPAPGLAPSPRPGLMQPSLPGWEGEIAHTAKGNKHQETSPDKKKRVFPWSEAPLQAMHGGDGDEGGEAGAAVMSANSLSFTGSPSLQVSAFSAETSEGSVPGELWGTEKV